MSHMSDSKEWRENKTKVQHLVGECFLKAANIILQSRVDEVKNTSVTRAPTSRRKWFNLVVDELQSAEVELSAWRHEQQYASTPLVIEIREASSNTADVKKFSRPEDSQGKSDDSGRLLEKWTIQWQSGSPLQSGSGSGSSSRIASSRLEAPIVYKRLIIMMRSLYSYTRLLPAFKLYKAATTTGSKSRNLQYKLLAQPVDELEQATKAMLHYEFAPVETLHGSIQMSVSYVAAQNLKFEESPQIKGSMPIIISDYVGQKPRSSLSESLSGSPASTISAHPQSLRRVTTMQAESSGEPADSMQSSSPFLRRHSWSLSSARSRDMAGMKVSQHSAQPSAIPIQSQKPSHNSQNASFKSNRSGPLAPGTPGTPMGSSATPPKYPSQGLATRVSQAAMSAASKVYAYSQGTSLPSSRSPLYNSSRNSPQRFDEKDMRRMSRQISSGESQRPDSAESAVVSPSRHSISKPVGIPGNPSTARRLRSSEDLRHMERADLPIKAASARKASQSKVAVSAPAAQTHFGFQPKQSIKSNPAETPIASPFASNPTSGREPTQQPGTPPAFYTLPSLGSESNSSVYSSILTSGSPQLPFACTPPKLSYSENPRKDLGAVQSSGFGQDPSANTPSWSNRSCGLENSSIGPGNVGYSVSTMLDSLGSSLFSSSAHVYHLPYSLQSQTLENLDPDAMSSINLDSARAFLPDQMLLMRDDPDHESLPFALDQEIISSAALSVQPGEVDKSMQDSECETDAAVGAFVQLIQDAPPLQRSIMPAGQSTVDLHSLHSPGPSGTEVTEEMTFQDGLDQLAQFKLRLSSHT